MEKELLHTLLHLQQRIFWSQMKNEEIAVTKDNYFPLYQQQYKTMSVELTKCSACLSTHCSENTSLLAFQIRKYSKSKLHT